MAMYFSSKNRGNRTSKRLQFEGLECKRLFAADLQPAIDASIWQGGPAGDSAATALTSSSIHGMVTSMSTQAYRDEIGLQDNYAPGNSEPRNASPGLQQWIPGVTTTGYDSNIVNRHFVDSFHGLSQVDVHSVTIGLKPIGDLSSNDRLRLSVRDHDGTEIERDNYSIGDDGPTIDNLVEHTWNTANYPDGVVLNIPLSDELKAAIRGEGFLDIIVQDDTSVDFVSLCGQQEVASPAVNETVELRNVGGLITTTTTDPGGLYSFENLPADSYTVTVPDHPWLTRVISAPASIALNGDQSDDNDFVVTDFASTSSGCGPFNATPLGNVFPSNNPQSNTIGFDGLNGVIASDQFASQGVTLGNLQGIGVQSEGDVNSVENLDGYDGTYAADGDNVLVSWPNHIEPMTITFDQPVSSFGAFVATGSEGETSTLSVYVSNIGSSGEDGFTVTVSPHENPDNREGYFAYQSHFDSITQVTILNDNSTDFGNALVIDNIEWAREADYLADTVDGDFDSDGDYDTDDIDALVAEIASGANTSAFDLTGDGVVDTADRDAWLMEAGEVNLGPGRAYLLGDANLDGLVGGTDFIQWNGNKFTSTPAWSAGDFTANGFVDGEDFIAWNGNKFTSADSASRGNQFSVRDEVEREDRNTTVDLVFAELT